MVERGTQYLRELAVLEVVYSDPKSTQLLTDPEEVPCTQRMWWTMAHHHRMLAHWLQWAGDTKHHPQWMRWLTGSCHIKMFSLLPSSQQWVNCPWSSSSSKRIIPTPHPHGPAPQLLTVIVLSLRREDGEGTHHGVQPWVCWTVWIGWPGTCRRGVRHIAQETEAAVCCIDKPTVNVTVV